MSFLLSSSAWYHAYLFVSLLFGDFIQDTRPYLQSVDTFTDKLINRNYTLSFDVTNYVYDKSIRTSHVNVYHRRSASGHQYAAEFKFNKPLFGQNVTWQFVDSNVMYLYWPKRRDCLKIVMTNQSREAIDDIFTETSSKLNYDGGHTIYRFGNQFGFFRYGLVEWAVSADAAVNMPILLAKSELDLGRNDLYENFKMKSDGDLSDDTFKIPKSCEKKRLQFLEDVSLRNWFNIKSLHDNSKLSPMFKSNSN